MATIKTANKKGKYYDDDSYQSVINYITNPQKAYHGYMGFIGVDATTPAESMAQHANEVKKNFGVRVRHFILSFAPWEPVTPEIANQIGHMIILYLGQQYQCVYAVHENKPHLHIHIVINSVSLIDGKKYRGIHTTFRQFLNEIRNILRLFGIFKLEYKKNQSGNTSTQG